MRAIAVCVDYADYLAVTLPYNRHQFESMLVVTSENDSDTTEIARQHGADVFATNAFYDDGASFNKWKALEQGLDHMGRTGQLCILDADVLLPKRVDLSKKDYRVGYLYSPHRRLMNAFSGVLPLEEDWENYPLHANIYEFAGYCQIFHADDPHLPDPPWHQINWKHAGGADSFFQACWPKNRKERLRFDVLHVGPPGQNWCGRSSVHLDGTLPEGGQEKRDKLRGFIAGRRKLHDQGKDRFAGEKI